MNEIIKTKIRDKHYILSKDDFNQWLLEFLTLDINDKDRDALRLEILRFVAENKLI